MLDDKLIQEKAVEFARKTDIRWNTEAKMHSYYSGYKDCQKEYEEKLQKAISALKIEIDYPECTLTNSRGDTFTFKNNSKNEGFIDFLSLHEEGLVSFL